MKTNSKLQIYKGIIRYLVESTDYNLKNIADLSGCPIKNIRSIYIDDLMPSSFSSELQLVKLYQFVLEIEVNRRGGLIREWK